MYVFDAIEIHQEKRTRRKGGPDPGIESVYAMGWYISSEEDDDMYLEKVWLGLDLNFKFKSQICRESDALLFPPGKHHSDPLI